MKIAIIRIALLISLCTSPNVALAEINKQERQIGPYPLECDCEKTNSLESQTNDQPMFLGRVYKTFKVTPYITANQIIVYSSWHQKTAKDIITVFSFNNEKDCGFKFHVGWEYLVKGRITKLPNIMKNARDNKEDSVIFVLGCDGSKLSSSLTPTEKSYFSKAPYYGAFR